MKKGLRTTVFWAALASAATLLFSAIAVFVGVEVDMDKAGGLLIAINALIGALSIGGILIDPNKVESFQAMMAKKK